MFFRTTNFNSEDTQSELSVFIVLLSLIRRSLPSDYFFRTSSPRKLETFSQNILSSGFSGIWFIRVDVDSCRLLLSSGSFLATDLQNFNPLEAGDVHSELLVFSLLRRLVLWNLQVLIAEAVQQNFWSSVFYQALDQKLDLQMLGRSTELPVQNLQMLLWQVFRTC